MSKAPNSPQVMFSLESRLQELAGAAGCTLQHMSLLDLRRSDVLKSEMRMVKLKDYFDDTGSLRFRGLGLSFAAKQYKETKDTFGSHAENETNARTKQTAFSARAIHLASDALRKDMVYAKERNEEMLRGVDETEKHRVQDVSRRQLESLFNEVPDFERFLCPGVVCWDLLPVGVSREDEARERRIAEKMLAHFGDVHWVEGKRMGWTLFRSEVLLLGETMNVWERASRGNNCPLGMDRPTFCRFVLDCGLIDQKKVPYYWAVSLFDSVTQPIRCCPSKLAWAFAHTGSVAVVANRWALISVMDVILRQHLEHHQKAAFFHQVIHTTRKRLKAYFALHPADELRLREVSGEEGLSDKRLRRNNIGVRPQNSVTPDELESMDMENGTAAMCSGKGSSAQLQSDAAGRERLIMAMLVEPEVLHLVTVHADLFRDLHACYSDEKGHMEFPMFMQFATDFQLSPQLVSSHFLKSGYESSACAEPACSPKVDVVASVSSSDAVPCSLPQVGHGAKQLSRRPSFVKQAPSSSKPGARPAAPQTCQQTAVMRAAPWTSRASTGRPTQRSSKDVASMQLMSAWASDTTVPPVSSERASSKVQGAAPQESAIFGVGAFAELLCRAALVYLGSYGTPMQQNTTGYARVVWLLAYLRCVFEHLSCSWRRRVASGKACTVHSELLTAIDKIEDRHWMMRKTSSQSPPFMVTTLQPLSGVGWTSQGAWNDGQMYHKAPRGSLLATPMLTPSSITLAATRKNPPAPIQEEPVATGDSFARKRRLAVERRRISLNTGELDESSSSDSPTNGTSVKPISCATTSPKHSPHETGELASPEWTMKELFMREAGEPCIVEGRCTLCQRTVHQEDWGNPRCRGCSTVDALAFEHHLFRRMLLPDLTNGRAVQLVARYPTRLKRSDLTPPPRPKGPMGLS